MLYVAAKGIHSYDSFSCSNDHFICLLPKGSPEMRWKRAMHHLDEDGLTLLLNMSHLYLSADLQF